MLLHGVDERGHGVCGFELLWCWAHRDMHRRVLKTVDDLGEELLKTLLSELGLVHGNRDDGTLPVVDFELPLRESESAALVHGHAGARLGEAKRLAENQVFEVSHLEDMKAR